MIDGKYRIVSKLAAGGFGSIYRAVDVRTATEVALKVLHRDLAADAHLSARFRREGAALARLRDPHTVAMFEVGEAADGTRYIAMELLAGRSLLAEFRSEGPLPWSRMLRVMRGVCSSLIEAHALGVVHRDLKPANIHLEPRGAAGDFAKVLDFGIAKLMHGSDLDDGSDLTRVGQAIGTLEYMSPEQILGGATDGRSDVYSLGVVAYEMITGRRPFAEASATSLMTAMLTGSPPAPSSLFHRECFPAQVDMLLLRCLARDPQDRFASAADLAAAIDDVLGAPAEAPRADALPATTLPGAGPRAPRAPATAARPARRSSVSEAGIGAGGGGASIATLRPGGPASVSGAGPMTLDDAEITMVDARPLFDAATWEPTAPAAAMLGRTPHLMVRSRLPDYHARAEGSSVGPVPASVLAPLPRRSSAISIAPPRAVPPGRALLVLWAVGLLASGVGLGLLVASIG
jgi:serine/threonine-protein kinase